MNQPRRAAAFAHQRAETLPLSAMQRAFWVQEMLSGDRGARAAVSFGVDFDALVDLDRLDGALTAIVKRHPLLRARFLAGHEEPSLSIEPAPSTILTRLPAEGAVTDYWCARPVSVLDWPPCRAAAMVHEGRTKLRITVNHAVFDAESKDVFLRDLARAYAGDPLASSKSKKAVLGDPQFWRRAVNRERQHAAVPASEFDPALAATASTHTRPRKPVLAMTPCESLRFDVESDLIAVVGNAAARLGVSKFTLHLTAWHAAIARLQVRDHDVVTPIALSTRQPSDAGEIGPFLNQLPVRSTAPRARGFRAVALELADVVRGLASNRHQRRAPGYQPQCDAPEVAVSYRRDTLGSLVWPGLTAIPVLLPPLQAPSADVVIRMLHRGSSTSGAIDVDPNAVQQGYGRRLERCWRALLRGGTQRLDARIGELPLVETK